MVEWICSFIYTDYCIILQVSKRSDLELTGRTDGNIAVVFPDEVAVSENGAKVKLKPGDYIHVKVVLNYCVCDVYSFMIVCSQITSATSRTLRGTPLSRTTLQQFHKSYGS